MAGTGVDAGAAWLDLLLVGVEERQPLTRAEGQSVAVASWTADDTQACGLLEGSSGRPPRPGRPIVRAHVPCPAITIDELRARVPPEAG